MIFYFFFFFFFFSSRRRHTRSYGDWSSDVCSSDLEELHKAFDDGLKIATSWLGQSHPFYVNGEARWNKEVEVGRASCRGKSVDLGGRRIIKKKKKKRR